MIAMFGKKGGADAIQIVETAKVNPRLQNKHWSEPEKGFVGPFWEITTEDGRRVRAGTCLSFLLLKVDMGECEHPLEHMGDINIQCDSDNARSIAIANSMGFTPKESSSFHVPKTDLRYVGFSSPAAHFHAYAESRIFERVSNPETAKPTSTSYPRESAAS
jgi:hypothetical protein